MYAGDGQSFVHPRLTCLGRQAMLTTAATKQSLAKVAHLARMGAEAAQLAAISPIFLAIAHGDDPESSTRLLSCE